MSDEYQIYLPASFQALYSTRSGRPTAPRADIMARYELCEDLATHLVEYARTMMFDLGLSEDEVLVRCHAGLLGDDAVVTEPEAAWVVERTAELAGWECPPSIRAGGP